MREINQESLRYNFSIIKQACSKKVCVMAKADAYGHGLVNVAMTLKNVADHFGVATIYEACQLRMVGIKNNILVVGKSQESEIELFCKNNIEMTVFSLFELEQLERVCTKNNWKIGVHIKINSGMNRLGVKSIKEFNLMQNCLKSSKNLKFCGIFTHFCSMGDDNKYFEKQKNIFKIFISAIDESFSPLIHVGGSGAIGERFDFCVDMVRVGLCLYGYSDKLPVQKVMKVVSTILQINEVLPYEMTGYYPCKTSSNPRRTATIFYGYADGIPKCATNKCNVKINGQNCEILGVCMDMIIVDVTNVVCKEGDKVIIFDDANLWAQQLGKIPYEVLTGFKNLRKH